jgi:hypothetical protein
MAYRHRPRLDFDALDSSHMLQGANRLFHAVHFRMQGGNQGVKISLLCHVSLNPAPVVTPFWLAIDSMEIVSQFYPPVKKIYLRLNS